MLEHVLSMYCSTHVPRHRSPFVPVIVSGKEYPKGTHSVGKGGRSFILKKCKSKLKQVYYAKQILLLFFIKKF